MSSLRFDRLSIAIDAHKGRQLRVRTDTSGWSRVDLAVFRSRSAPRADAAVTLSRDGLDALIHALEAARDSLEQRREEWLASPDGQDWLAQRADAA